MKNVPDKGNIGQASGQAPTLLLKQVESLPSNETFNINHEPAVTEPEVIMQTKSVIVQDILKTKDSDSESISWKSESHSLKDEPDEECVPDEK